MRCTEFFAHDNLPFVNCHNFGSYESDKTIIHFDSGPSHIFLLVAIIAFMASRIR